MKEFETISTELQSLISSWEHKLSVMPEELLSQ